VIYRNKGAMPLLPGVRKGAFYTAFGPKQSVEILKTQNKKSHGNSGARNS